MRTLRWTMQMVFWVMLGLFNSGQQRIWAAGEVEYRFERMLPQLEQHWDFARAGGIASAPDGSLWVIDSDNRRLLHLHTYGSLIAQFESELSSNGLSGNPAGIAFAPDGSIWVTDSYNRHIQHLNADGGLIAQFGGVQGAGQLNYPESIAVAKDGSVWVVDTNSLQHFDADGSFIAQLGNRSLGVDSTGYPIGIAVSADGSIWVSYSDHRILHLNNNGDLISKFGSFGSDPGQFNWPSDIELAADGSLWVVDRNNNRLQHFDAKGRFIAQFGNPGAMAGQFHYPHYMALAADGSLWVTDNENQRLQHFKADGSFLAQLGDPGSGVKQFQQPESIIIAQDESVWVADTGNSRILHFKSDGGFIAQLGSQGLGVGQFDRPEGISLATDGSLWVADTGHSRFQHFKVNGDFIEQFGSWGQYEGEFIHPRDLKFATDGSVWALDSLAFWGRDSWIAMGARIQHIHADGSYISRFPGNIPNPYFYIGGFALGADNSVWITESRILEGEDTLKNFIQHIKGNGGVITEFGSTGSGSGQFSAPRGITLEADGSVWIADSGNHRLQHFKADGGFIEQFGSKGTGAGKLSEPKSIAIADDGHMWVTETGNNRIQKFVLRSKGVTAQPYKAIILAGGGEKSGSLVNDSWDGVWQVALKAYKAFERQGFKAHEEILFLTADNSLSDLDGNGLSDDLQPATKDRLRQVITEWAKDSNDVVLFLAAPGGSDKFQINGNESLTGEELSGWLSELEKSIPGKVTVVIESANPGSFVAALANKNRPRNVFTGTKAGQAAVMANHGVNSFAYAFWSKVMDGVKLKDAFTNARQTMSNFIINNQTQDAQADSNADAQSTALDLTTLGDYCIGNCNQTTAGPPTLTLLSPNSVNLDSVTRLELKIKVSHSENLLEAWALVQRPDDLSNDPDKPLNFEKVPLICDAGQEQCSGYYNRFDTQGQYRVYFSVLDTRYKVSTPETLLVTQAQSQTAAPVEYDDKHMMLYLYDVEVAGLHYQAVLQNRNGLFYLLDAGLVSSIYSPSAGFDTATNLLNIPLGRAYGQMYQAIFKQVGNSVFQLKSATLK